MLYRSTRSGTGFTLLEVLVVVAIITLLAAMLFPVFARAQGSGLRSSCQSNLKQLSIAAFQYTQDYDERFPLGLKVEGELPDGSPHYFVALDMVQPYIKNRQVAICPSDANEPDLDLMLPGCEAVSYTVNDQIFNSPELGGTPPVSLAQINRPSEVTLLWDAKNISHDPANAELQVAKRHLEGADVAFADGHVKFLKTKPLLADDDVHWNANPEAN